MGADTMGMDTLIGTDTLSGMDALTGMNTMKTDTLQESSEEKIDR